MANLFDKHPYGTSVHPTKSAYNILQTFYSCAAELGICFLQVGFISLAFQMLLHLYSPIKWLLSDAVGASYFNLSYSTTINTIWLSTQVRIRLISNQYSIKFLCWGEVKPHQHIVTELSSHDYNKHVHISFYLLVC